MLSLRVNGAEAQQLDQALLLEGAFEPLADLLLAEVLINVMQPDGVEQSIEGMPVVT